MQSLKILSVLAVSTLLGSAVAEAGVPNNPVFPKPVPVKAEPMFVVFNGVVCFVAPCPSFTAVTADGEVLELTDVQLPEKVKPELADELSDSGLQVQAIEVDGVLFVEKVIKAGKTYTAFDNGIRCKKAPCPSITSVTQAGSRRKVANVDFSALKVSLEEEGELLQSLLAGDIAVDGFIVPGAEKSVELLVMKVAAVTETFEVSNSGIVCIVAPCPSILATPLGGEGIHVTDINLQALSLSSDETDELLNAVFQDSVKVRGYIDHNQQQFGQGTVLHVTGLAE